MLGNGGIELLGDRIDNIRIVDRHHDRFPQVVITLDMRRYADLMDDIGDDHFKSGASARVGDAGHIVPTLAPGKLHNPFGQHLDVEGAQKIVNCTGCEQLPLDHPILIIDRHHELRLVLGRSVMDCFHHSKRIEMGHYHVDDGDSRILCEDHFHHLCTVPRCGDGLISISAQRCGRLCAELLIILCYQHLHHFRHCCYLLAMLCLLPSIEYHILP